jgi:hypothetical protein
LDQFAPYLKLQTLDLGENLPAEAIREFLRVLVGRCRSLQLLEYILDLTG